MIVVVHGPPAAGKTTLARSLGRALGLSILSTDQLGAELIQTQRQAGGAVDYGELRSAAYETIFGRVFEQAAQPEGFIVEGCFNPDGAPSRIRAAIANRQSVVEIFLSASEDTLVDRYRRRAEGSDPLHHHDPRTDKLLAHLRRCRYRPMQIGVWVALDAEQATSVVLAQALATISGASPT